MKNCYRNRRPCTITLIPLKEKTEFEIKLKDRDFSFESFSSLLSYLCMCQCL